MANKFRSNRTDVRKRSKKIGTAKRKRNPMDYRPPRTQKIQPHSGYKATRKANQLLGATSQCQTIIGGRKVWVAATDRNGRPIIRNGKVVRYPAIVIPEENPSGHRCPNEASVSRMRNGATEHKCAGHLGIWYVDEDGHKRNYDDEIVG